MSRRRASAVVIPEEVRVETSPEEVEVPRAGRGRPRIDPSLDEAPVMTFRATAAFETRVKELARERDESIGSLLRQACEIGLKALAVPPVMTRSGKF